MRKKIVAGNWKMNLDYKNAMTLMREFVAFADAGKFSSTNNVLKIIFPPFPYLEMMSTGGKAASIKIGAQNCSDKESGAYTGEVSAAIIHSCGADYCIVGHSERRTLFNESDEILALKVNACIKNNLTPVFCIGETLSQRESNKHFSVIEDQLNKGLFHLTNEQINTTVIAYEPVWAIGTGVTASAQQAQEMHAFIRSLIQKKYGDSIATNISILYGGSCNPKNAKELFACADIDGGLIGGASLKADDFLAIINSF